MAAKPDQKSFSKHSGDKGSNFSSKKPSSNPNFSLRKQDNNNRQFTEKKPAFDSSKPQKLSEPRNKSFVKSDNCNDSVENESASPKSKHEDYSSKDLEFNDEEWKQIYGNRSAPPRSKKQQFYLDFQLDANKTERVIIQLNNDVPLAAENFRALCLGTITHPETNEVLTYKGTNVHMIHRKKYFVAGDIVDSSGNGSMSIYGNVFQSEGAGLERTHEAGTVSLFSVGLDKNDSKFLIAMDELKPLNGKCVVIGKVVKGLDTCKRIASMPSNTEGRPKTNITIVDCGRTKKLKSEHKNTSCTKCKSEDLKQLANTPKGIVYECNIQECKNKFTIEHQKSHEKECKKDLNPAGEYLKEIVMDIYDQSDLAVYRIKKTAITNTLRERQAEEQESSDKANQEEKQDASAKQGKEKNTSQHDTKASSKFSQNKSSEKKDFKSQTSHRPDPKCNNQRKSFKPHTDKTSEQTSNSGVSMRDDRKNKDFKSSNKSNSENTKRTSSEAFPNQVNKRRNDLDPEARNTKKRREYTNTSGSQQKALENQ